MTRSDGSGVLLAVLLNPPRSTPGTRTRNAVERAGRVLGFESVKIANLCSVATPTVVELNKLGDSGRWHQAREQLTGALRDAEGLLAGWGVAGLSGGAQRARQAQVDWLYSRAREVGIETIWMVGGEPRHPSRWHQFVSDKYGRTSGGTFEERLEQVMVAMSIAAPNRSSSHAGQILQPARQPEPRRPRHGRADHHSYSPQARTALPAP
jgi:hypothetical protein